MGPADGHTMPSRGPATTRDGVCPVSVPDREAPRRLPSMPCLHKDAYHGIAGEIVTEIAPQTEADPAAMLVSTLASAGAMIGDGPHVRIGAAKHPPGSGRWSSAGPHPAAKANHGRRPKTSSSPLTRTSQRTASPRACPPVKASLRISQATIPTSACWSSNPSSPGCSQHPAVRTTHSARSCVTCGTAAGPGS
jgi:hypothetical protein